MRVVATISFHDKKEGVFRAAGDSFSMDEKRYREINDAGYGELVHIVEESAEQAEESPSVDYKRMRRDELIELAKERGIKVAEETKAEIIALLEG